jgi:hypothetical protein
MFDLSLVAFVAAVMKGGAAVVKGGAVVVVVVVIVAAPGFVSAADDRTDSVANVVDGGDDGWQVLVDDGRVDDGRVDVGVHVTEMFAQVRLIFCPIFVFDLYQN